LLKGIVLKYNNYRGMPIYDQIQDILKDRIGSIVTASEIKHALKTKYGTNASSIIPSDYCYNRFNKGIRFNKHIFEYIDHKTYKYLGENYLFTGLIFHKPANQDKDFIVGEWIVGRKIFYLTPVLKDSPEGLKIADHSARMVVKLTDPRPSGADIPTTNKHHSFLPQLHSVSQIKDLISRADDYDETKRLINKIDGLKTAREPFYLDINELDDIFHWKLRGQYSRQKRNTQLNTDELVRDVTKYAFSISGSDESNVVKLMLKALIILHGVQIPVASAIMTLCYPEKYCVVDFRGWRQVYGKEKEHGNYTITEYLEYWTIIKCTANKYGVTPQELDMALWQYDIENCRNK